MDFQDSDSYSYVCHLYFSLEFFFQDGSFDTIVDTFGICSFEQPVQVQAAWSHHMKMDDRHSARNLASDEIGSTSYTTVDSNTKLSALLSSQALKEMRRVVKDDGQAESSDVWSGWVLRAFVEVLLLEHGASQWSLPCLFWGSYVQRRLHCNLPC